MRVRVGRLFSFQWTVILCVACFCMGMFFTNRLWNPPEGKDVIRAHEVGLNPDQQLHFNHDQKDQQLHLNRDQNVQAVSELHCDPKPNHMTSESASDTLKELSKTNEEIRILGKTISSLEMELAEMRAAQAAQFSSPPVKTSVAESPDGRQKAIVVIGINTAFSSRRRRDSVRESWMPTGEKLKKLEQEKGIIIKFVIGHSATPGGILDRAIDAENAQHGDFLRLDHVEGYNELSAKTKIYFTTAVSKWDADFYVKVDDDVHVNLGMLVTTLGRYQSKPRVYAGCMKSGPVLADKGVKYHEPEFWKFGEEGNKYFRHATGQIYAISKDLATYISTNQPILHKYANEDVSLGAWFIGLDVEHVDDRSFCCATPPDCEWKAQAGSVCVASFDWPCSGICKSADRIQDVHQRCGEGDDAVWSAMF